MTGTPYAGPPATGGPPGTPPNDRPPYWQPPYGQPYAQPYGQPPYGQPPYGTPAPWGSAPWGSAPWGSAPWGPAPWGQGAPHGPRRPGQVTAAAVLSFVQAGLVLFATLYLWLVVSLGRLAAQTLRGPVGGGPLVAEGTVLAIVQVVSVVALLAAGGLALSRRTRLAWGVILVAGVLQVALAGYWATRLPTVLSDLSSGAPDNGFVMVSVMFAAGPLVALGLVLVRPGRTWFDGTPRP